MKKAIVIDQTMGAWAGNPYTGTVTGNIALGYLVIDGKKVGRVKDCMFSLNVFTHLKSNLLAVSKETKNLGQMILPYCLIEGVSIAGAIREAVECKLRFRHVEARRQLCEAERPCFQRLPNVRANNSDLL